MTVGNRIFLKRELPEKALIKEFGLISASNIADVMERSCAMNPRIRLVSSPKQPIVSGPAFTVKGTGGDNLLLHAALDIAEEGDIIVVSNEGASTRSLMGEIMAVYAYKVKKIAAIVLDGPIRDIDVLGKMDIPLYATGTNPGGPYKEGPGEINVPIACGEIPVIPGDIIVADADGVIVIPKKDAPDILLRAKKFQVDDAAKVREAEMGTLGRDWLEKKLKERNTEIIDSVFSY